MIWKKKTMKVQISIVTVTCANFFTFNVALLTTPNQDTQHFICRSLFPIFSGATQLLTNVSLLSNCTNDTSLLLLSSINFTGTLFRLFRCVNIYHNHLKTYSLMISSIIKIHLMQLHSYNWHTFRSFFSIFHLNVVAMI